MINLSNEITMKVSITYHKREIVSLETEFLINTYKVVSGLVTFKSYIMWSNTNQTIVLTTSSQHAAAAATSVEVTPLV